MSSSFEEPHRNPDVGSAWRKRLAAIGRARVPSVLSAEAFDHLSFQVFAEGVSIDQPNSLSEMKYRSCGLGMGGTTRDPTERARLRSESGHMIHMCAQLELQLVHSRHLTRRPQVGAERQVVDLVPLFALIRNSSTCRMKRQTGAAESRAAFSKVHVSTCRGAPFAADDEPPCPGRACPEPPVRPATD